MPDKTTLGKWREKILFSANIFLQVTEEGGFLAECVGCHVVEIFETK